MGALIAAGVITAAGAVTAGAMSASAASKAAKAQGAAAKAARRQEKKALKGFQKGQAQIETDLGQIQAPTYDINAMIRDAELASASARKQGFGSEAEYEQIRAQTLKNIKEGLAGQLTEAELGAVRREQAFLQGAGFNPAMAGRGAIQPRGSFNYLRAVGETAGEKIRDSLGFLGQWTDIANMYIRKPEVFGELQYQYGMGAANVGLEKAGIRSNMLAAQYGAQTGASQKQYQRQQENVAASKAASDAQAEWVRGGTAAVGSAIAGGAGAYGQYATAANASTTPMSSGFYRGEVGAANAYGVAPSQLSYQAPSGGFLGMGGQGGGYYYNPSGVYGR